MNKNNEGCNKAHDKRQLNAQRLVGNSHETHLQKRESLRL